MNHIPEHKAMLDSLLLGMPGVKASKSWGYPSYKINGRIFAFVGGPGIAIKLPEARVKALIGDQPEYKPFQPTEGTVWREWLSIDREQSEDYAQDIDLLEESALYVAERN